MNQTHSCEVCHTEFIGRKSQRYCSRACWQHAPRPRRTAVATECRHCGVVLYRSPQRIAVSKQFCDKRCHDAYQSRGKVEYRCKMCGRPFLLSPSRARRNNITYCSIRCRNDDPDWVLRACVKRNMVQQHKQGPNKLERAGAQILRDLGVDFAEQVLMFDKFLVDVTIPGTPIVIQWDGEYWHNRPARRNLDTSQDAYLTKCGHRVLRYTDKQVYTQREWVSDDIRRAIQEFAA